MKLLIITLCLLSERYLVHSVSHLRFNWFPSYLHAINQRLPKNSFFSNPIVILVVTLLPLLILFALALLIFNQIAFGLGGFLLNLAIFYYCLGPHNPFYPVRLDTERVDSEADISNYFFQVNGQLFAVIFWYIVLGALGVLLYRLISLCQEQESTAPLATQLTNLLDWIPARISLFLFLLVGNFQHGLQFFLQRFLASPANNAILLGEGGLLALRTSETKPVQMPYAENLVEHAVIVYLVFLALFTLVALL